MGGAKVAGRRVADGHGRPVVLTALGSGEKLFAVLPLAILSVGSVAGLAAITDGGAATPPSAADPGAAAAGSLGHEPAARRVLARATPSPAPAAVSATRSVAALDEGTSPEPIDEASTGGSTGGSAGAPAETASATDTPAAEDPATPAPTSSTTAAPEPTGGDTLTEAEATAQCVASGISATDVLELGACVEELLD